MMGIKLTAATPWESSYESRQPQFAVPNNQFVAIQGGLNDWDGANNYFNLFGAKVIVEERDITNTGTVRLVLRREDGRNFYGLYPILNAELYPLEFHDKLIINP